MSDIIELGEPDVIRNEDNILWLRAEIERLTAESKADKIRLADMEATCEFLHETEADNERLQARVEAFEGVGKAAHDELMNLQPHIPECCYPQKQPFIDAHVDVAMELLAATAMVRPSPIQSTMTFIPTGESLPKTDVPVLVTDGKCYMIAMYCHEGEHEGESYDEIDVGCWSEDENHWYWPAGWYEQQICWDEYQWLQVHDRDFIPTHWAALPPVGK